MKNMLITVFQQFLIYEEGWSFSLLLLIVLTLDGKWQFQVCCLKEEAILRNLCN